MPEEEREISPAVAIVGAGLGLSLLGVLALAALTRAAPPEEPEPGLANLYGRVTDAQTGEPIAGVQVTLEEGTPVSTDSNGHCAILNIAADYFPFGAWIYFRKDGYEDKNVTTIINEGNNELNVQMIPTGEPPEEPEETVELTRITVNPTDLTDARHEYETYLGLGYWGDEFTISITFSNPFDYDVWVRPDYAFGNLTGEPLEYVNGTLRGFVAEKLLYFRLLLDSAYVQGDYSYTVDWQQLYHPQQAGSNMPRFVYDPDGIAVLMAGGDCWLKVPARGEATTVKQAHLGRTISAALPAVFDLCVVANKAFYLVYDPHYRTVGGVQYLINWSPVALDPCASAVPDMVSITPI